MTSSRAWRLPTLTAVAVRAADTTATGVLGLALTTDGDVPRPHTAMPYYARLVLAAMRGAQERGYLLLTMPSSLSPWVWLNTPLDGVIRTAPQRDDRIRAILLRRGIPIVGEGRPPEPDLCEAWVEADHASALRLLLDHMADAGALRIGVTLPTQDDDYSRILRHTYHAWCVEHRRPQLVADYAPLPDCVATEQAAVHQLLSRGPGPDAVIGVYSGSGYITLAAAREHQLEVPRDLMVGCLSEDSDYSATIPPVTTVSTQPDERGVEAVDLLVSVINDRRGLNRRRRVEPMLIARQSTARARPR